MHGRDAALAVPGIVGLEITVPSARTVIPLPEGDRYLGFLFARGDTPGGGRSRAAGRADAARYRHHVNDRFAVKVLLVSTYELGHQPLGVAAPAGALRARGHDVRALDLAVDDWDPDSATWADRVAISVPMHTAARLAHEIADRSTARSRASGSTRRCAHDVGAALVGRDPVSEVVRWVEDDPTITVTSPVPARDLLAPPDEYASNTLNE